MLYMVIERFKPDAAFEIYRLAKEHGRLLPEGLEYIASWVDLNFNVCFQLMQTEDERLLQQWISRWQAFGDFCDFEVIAVRTSAEAFQAMAHRL